MTRADEPVTALHAEPYNLTYHQTRPLRDHGTTTVQALLDLVAEHEQLGEESALAKVPGMGRTRLAKVTAAAQCWRDTHAPTG